MPTADQWKSFKDELVGSINQAISQGKIPEDLHSPASELADILTDSTDPKDIWLLSDSKIGKQILLGKEWSGFFDLQDPDVTTRLNNYLGRD